jgi:hypothetical protein
LGQSIADRSRRERPAIDRSKGCGKDRKPSGPTAPASPLQRQGGILSSKHIGREAALLPSQIDFVRGIQKQAEALGSDQPPFFSGRVTLHLTELTLALHAGLHDYQVRTSFDSSPQ